MSGGFFSQVVWPGVGGKGIAGRGQDQGQTGPFRQVSVLLLSRFLRHTKFLTFSTCIPHSAVYLPAEFSSQHCDNYEGKL